MTDVTLAARRGPVERTLGILESGLAWEREEFLPGWACAAVPVRGRDSADHILQEVNAGNL